MRLWLAIFIAVLTTPFVSRADVARPTVPIAPANCVTSECHLNVKNFPVLHGPVAADSCDACHLLADPLRHTFTLRANGADLCTYCHEFSVEGLAVVHKPVQRGECLGCHNPHGGTTRAIVREKSMKELCNRCHESITAHDTFVHAPVAQGECDSCHPPHASKFPKLLDAVGTDLCLTCHTDFERQMAQSNFRHKALKDGCEKCHDVHGSSTPMSLRDAPPALCFQCHDKLKAEVAAAKVSHSPVTEPQRSCLNCHTPHFSNAPRLQPAKTASQCMKCHDEPIKSDGGTIAPVSEILDPNQLKHGQIKDDECAGCHDVHGGAFPMLLKRTLSGAYYQRFSKENFALCFGCHDARLVQEKKTTSLTAFRNGDVNLHAVHANRDDRDKGCNVCHVTHASPNPRLIRTFLSYGIWSMPMRFEKTDTGGSCFPGCHRKLAYDREKPVPATTTTTTRESPVIARAQRRDDQSVHWIARDRDGETVTLPDPTRPTILLLVCTNADAGKLAACASPKRAELVVLIACGVDAEKITALDDVPVIVDRDLAVADALDVHGWPTAVVLRPDGIEVARLSGDPQTLAWKLPPYVDLAAGIIDRAEVQKRLATTAPSEDPAKEARRMARVAQAQVDQKDFAAALREAQEGLQLFPDSAELAAVRVESLLGLNQVSDAAAALATLHADQLPAPQYAILQSRLSIAQQQWSDARKTVEAALSVSPRDPRLHFLMGQICEHDQDWPAATAHYRNAGEQSISK
jgi:predicted CXXCH cytochrome family protein